MESTIHRFNGVLLAFFRPVKRTYYFLKWDNEKSMWVSYNENHPPFKVHLSTVHAAGEVTIRIQKGRANSLTSYQTRIVCEGQFLKLANLCVPIAKAAQPVAPARIGKEYTIMNHGYHQHDDYILNVNLWSVAEPAAPATPTQQQRRKPLAPIPRRIAWLIAEDAAKNKETCSISMDEISPITAAVTTCFHVFDSASLKEWFDKIESPKKTCPVCRETCVSQEAYQESE